MIEEKDLRWRSINAGGGVFSVCFKVQIAEYLETSGLKKNLLLKGIVVFISQGGVLWSGCKQCLVKYYLKKLMEW